MKDQLLFLLGILLFISIPIHSQEDVKLFDYWEFYSDSENSMYKTSCSIAFEQISERKEEILQLSSKDDYINRQLEVKQKLSQLLGPMPDKTPLNARVTGVIKKKDYRVEKVIYESVPGFYVTAALFIPKKRKGKTPAIIYASGHTKNGFRSETYQPIIINLVKKGFIVLAFDPVGQGERQQYYNEKEGKSRFGPTTEHSYPGAQCYISGYSPTKYFVWDAIRSVDYLLSRKEVDPERIGMTGRSGGGTQTAYAAAMDDRIFAAAPECFISGMEYILKSIGPQDAEQNLFHMISEGLDHADLLEVRAPRPGLMVTTTRDFFSIQGARETYNETKQFYKELGHEDRMHMVEDDDGHTSTKKNREAMYSFFQKYLNNPGNNEDLDVEILEEKELWATETGQLSTSLPGETLFSLNKKVVENQVSKLNISRANKNIDKFINDLSDGVKRLSGFEQPKKTGKALFSGRFVNENYITEKYLIPGGGDYMLPTTLFRPSKNQKEEIILILDEKGMEHTFQETKLLHSLLEEGYSVLFFDVRGIGSLGPGYIRGDSYIDNTSFNQWFAGILTNKSGVAMRAEDIIRIVHFIESDIKEINAISAISIGVVGSELLHAAVSEDAIQKVCMLEPFLSFSEIALTNDYAANFIPSTVGGAIEKYDLPDLIAAICPRKVLIVNPLSANGEYKKNTEILSYPKQVYTQKGVGNRINYLIGQDAPIVNKQILEWLK